MPSSAGQKIRIRWVRSGIGFPKRQKEMVRSLGLRKLHQVVERPDTPQIRGLVARIAHLVAIVGADVAAPWKATPEYTIRPVEKKAEVVATSPERAAEAVTPEHKPAPKVEAAEKVGKERVPARAKREKHEPAAKPAKLAKPAKHEEAKPKKAKATKSKPAPAKKGKK